MKIVSLAALLATVAFAQGPTPLPSEHPKLKVPPGFSVEEYAAGFQRPRFMVEGRGGEVLLSDTTPNGSVYAIKGQQKKLLISGLDRPYGLALWKDYLYVAETTSVKRYKYDSKAMSAGPGKEVVSLAGFTKGHVTRTIVFDSKGKKMYLAVGSSADFALGDPVTRAAINRYNPDGSGHEVFASGIRNPVGLRFYPGTDQLWATVEERDDLPGVQVADYFTSIRPGGFYGWPYAYLGPHADPRAAGKRDDLVKQTIAPDVLLAPHVAVLDFLFYTGKQFPAEYRGGAFLANHGGSNGVKRLGYSLSFIPFRDRKPCGPVRDFLTGPLSPLGQKPVWGRPVALLQLHDGSLLMSDDGGKKIWRISYKR